MPKCNLLNNHACLSIEGNWRVCCKFDDSHKFSANSYNFNQFKTTPYYKNVSKILETGWHPGCQKCKDDEEIYNIESLRQYSLRELSGKDQLEYMEINLSNDCNLNCRMCGPRYSSTWEKFLHEHQQLDSYYNKELFEIHHKNIDVSKLFENVDLSNLKVIKYLGGEPFVTKQILDLFKFLDSKNLMGQIEFQANTNCTLFPKKHVEYLKKFKNIIMSLSVDAVGNLNDYIRNGSQWNHVDKIIDMWIEFSQQHNCRLILAPTLLPYNVHDLTAIRTYAEYKKIKYKLHRLVFPERFRLDVLPLKYLRSIENEDNTFYISLSKFNQKWYDEFKDFTNKFDTSSNRFIKNYIPLLNNYL